MILLPAAAWLAALLIALAASEALVRLLSHLGHRWALNAGILGFLVALGADAPELTSALFAVQRGAGDVGFGVLIGSSIYNLAFLLGLSALLAGPVSTGAARYTVDGAFNALTTGALALLAWLPATVRGVAGVLVALLGGYLAVLAFNSRAPEREQPSTVHDHLEAPPYRTPARIEVLLLGVVVAVAVIVLSSNVLVQMSLQLGQSFDIPAGVLGTFVLAIATSLPNTWAAVSLARRGRSAVALSTAFNSNIVNASAGVGIPVLVLGVRVSRAVQIIDVPALLVLTGATLAVVATRSHLRRWEGVFLIGLYICFVLVRAFVVGAG